MGKCGSLFSGCAGVAHRLCRASALRTGVSTRLTFDAEPRWSVCSPRIRSIRPLFQRPLLDTAAPLFDVAAAGKRVIALTPADPEANSIGLLVNWTAELKK